MRPWWQDAVVYQIYPRSFLDTDGDGVGDLEGIRRRIPYLVDLGVDAIWLSPFYRSPMKDFGYDVSDYCDVDPLFGTLADFDALVADAHGAGLRVIVDWVPNHSSSEHPWFVDARSSRQAAHRDWYVWRDGDGVTPPNNWEATFVGGPAWTWDEATAQWYLHLFLPEQPDLDWSNPEVVAAMEDVLRFWLDRGVDGFRVDVTHCLGKDPDLPDDPPAMKGMPHSALNDHPSTHPILRRLRTIVDSYPGDRMLVGEVFLLSTSQVAAYYGAGDELHLSFNFPPLFAPWDPAVWRRRIESTIAHLDPIGAWPTWVLSNHDNPRHRTRYGGSEDRARAAALMLLGLRGTPFLYAGEELGLGDAAIPPERAVDPGGRDGCRAPIPWEHGRARGWPVDEAWLPWPDGPDAATQHADAGSVWHLYRAGLAQRRGSEALRSGTFTWMDGPPGVLMWRRSAGPEDGPEEVVVAVNMTEEAIDLEPHLDGLWAPALRSCEAMAGLHLPASAAVWLRPVDRR